MGARYLAFGVPGRLAALAGNGCPRRACLEAALESAGILDAWLTPGGDLIAGDVALVSGRHPVTGPSCDNVLVPAVNTGDPRAAALSEAAVRAALSAIGLGEGTGAAFATLDAATDGRDEAGAVAGVAQRDGRGAPSRSPA